MEYKRHFRIDFYFVWLGIAAITLILAACKGKSGKEDSTDLCGCSLEPPSVTLYMVPLDGMTPEKVKKLGEKFLKNFGDRQSEEFQVEVFPFMKVPDSCLNDARTRLRADKIIAMLNQKYSGECRKKATENNSHYHVMGVTTHDISTTVHGHKDYGILGLSYLRGPHVGVVSTFRLKNQNKVKDDKDLWKLTAHELCHGFYHCPHCMNDDPHCLMADAKGGDPGFYMKDSLCKDCAKICIIGD